MAEQAFDVWAALTISRKLTVTLNVYGHFFEKTDEAAAAAIDEALGSKQ